MCGRSFDPVAHAACESCPLHDGCSVVCCPACGYRTVDPGRSGIVRLGTRLAGRLRRSAWERPEQQRATAGTLADVPSGWRARVARLDGLPAARQEYLQAYGVAPGRWLRVVQRTPVTVVRVEHTDLAFEPEIARGVEVEAVDAG
jgi:Fe2+ transport system protein FeoA